MMFLDRTVRHIEAPVGQIRRRRQRRRRFAFLRGTRIRDHRIDQFVDDDQRFRFQFQGRIHWDQRKIRQIRVTAGPLEAQPGGPAVVLVRIPFHWAQLAQRVGPGQTFLCRIVAGEAGASGPNCASI